MKTLKITKNAALIMTFLLLFTQQAFAQSYSGGRGTEARPYEISTADDIIEMHNTPEDWGAYFKMTANIDLSSVGCFSTAVIAPDTQPGYVFEGTPFTGNFNGQGYTISNLCIDASAINYGSYLGLFGKVQGVVSEPDKCTIHNLHLENVSIKGSNQCDYVGALVGESFLYSSIQNCSSSGSVSKGGLPAGSPSGGDIGGLIGEGLNISNCWSTCTVTAGGGSGGVGGLAGQGSDITCSYAAGSVSVGPYFQGVGGLVGYSSDIVSCYATGNVTADSNGTWLGGLVGMAELGMNGIGLLNCYATGSVTTGLNAGAGGLIGYAFLAPITNCYSTGYIDAEHGSGLIFDNLAAPVSNCFWDIETSGCDTSEGGIGLTTDLMQTENTFTDAGWDFIDTWYILPQAYPMLKCQAEEQSTSLHFHDIAMSSTTEKGKDYAVATITIADGIDNPVYQASVWIEWLVDGVLLEEYGTGTTLADGTAPIKLPVVPPCTVEARVYSLFKPGYTYTPADNDWTTDSIYIE